MVYLGGQHLQQQLQLPRKVNDWVYQPFNVNRTHCYALQGGDTIRELYQHLNDARTWRDGHHIDHHYGEWLKKNPRGVFVPRTWLAGQIEGLSSITYKQEQENIWLGAEELVSGRIDRPMVAVLGTYRGGTSCSAGVLHHLGIELGGNLKEPNDQNPAGFFEDELLGEVCRNIFSEPWLVREADSENAASLLRWWASKMCREIGDSTKPLCGKYPILSMLVPELETAWNSPKFIAIDRPFEDAANSLKRAGWGWPLEAIEYVLPRIIKARDEALAACRSDHLHINFDELRREPRVVIDRLNNFLNHSPSSSQVEAAVNFVRSKQ